VPRYHDPGKKYDEMMKLGNTTVNIIYPEPMSEAELERRIHLFCLAAWAIILNNEDDEN
jgi:hypothetical protein